MKNNIGYTQKEFEEKLDLILQDKFDNPDLLQVYHPKLIFIAGQPGAGKSRITEFYKKNLGNNVIVSDIDEYRNEHPRFKELVNKYPNQWTQYTQDFASEMGKAVVKELSKSNCNVIIDGTLKNYNKNKEIIDMYRKAGYSIEISAIATKPDVSTMGIIKRYTEKIRKKEPARSVPIEVHNMTIEALPNNLERIQLENLVDAIYLFDRTSQCIYDSTVNQGTLAGNVLERVYKAPLSKLEKIKIKKDCLSIVANLDIKNNNQAFEYLQLSQDVLRKTYPEYAEELEKAKHDEIAKQIGNDYVEAVEEVEGENYCMAKGAMQQPSQEFLANFGNLVNHSEKINQINNQKDYDVEKEL